MGTAAEWKARIDAYRSRLQTMFYRPLGPIDLEGFVTKDRLTAGQAARGKFKPMPAGSTWGGKWEYGWFRGQVKTPREAAGLTLAVHLQPGAVQLQAGTPYCEGLLFVNGKALCAVEWPRPQTILATKAAASQSYRLLLESYAGHGPENMSAGPVPPGVETVPEPPARQLQIKESTFGVWEEDLYQLWLDLETLYLLRSKLDDSSLRANEIDAGLREATILVDLELPRDAMLKTVAAGRKRLRPLLECVNGSTAPDLFAFGHAHLDVAWLWPLEETRRKIARTFSNQLDLIQRYPGYRFLQSEPHLYHMLREDQPELYARVKRAVRAGRVIADGGMYVEADTNVSGGEALIRQFLVGKRFFQEEFGVENEVLWLPDVFGYSGAMPQILRGCGVKYFATAKIFWNYYGGQNFPYNTFTWEGIDGSEVLAHLYMDYNSQTDPAFLIGQWKNMVQKDGISSRLLPFGIGDGGGGPTRTHLEFVRREADLEGMPRVGYSSPQEFFEDLQRRGVPPHRYVGELYFQAHRGTYTSQAKTKKGNRKSELALREAECWSAAAGALAGYKMPRKAMDEAWRKVLVNQFHDVLPGSSIGRVYEDAERHYAEVLATAANVTRAAAGAIAKSGKAMTVFNSLNWQRNVLVELPANWRARGAVDSTGREIPTQKVEGKTLAEVPVASVGWTTVLPAPALANAKDASGVEASAKHLENELVRIKFNDRGEIVSILDKQTGEELAAGPCNSLQLYKDTPGYWDGWDVDSHYKLMPVDLHGRATVDAVASGPLVGMVRFCRKINESDLTQEIRLRRGSRRVDFVTRIEWRERHKLLKVNFASGVRSSEAIHEIQFGHLRRPTHASTVFDADRFEVCNHKWTALAEEGRGFAVLNDCKYGVNVEGSSINLTLLRSPMAPDMNADRGTQEFTYACTFWNGSFGQSGVVREAYDLNVPPTVAPGNAGTASLLGVDAPNIVLEAIKPAEDGSGDVILRLYESKRMATRCRLTTALKVAGAWQTDMLEENRQTKLALRKEIASGGQGVSLEFRPFEIKTVRLTLK